MSDDSRHGRFFRWGGFNRVETTFAKATSALLRASRSIRNFYPLIICIIREENYNVGLVQVSDT